MPCTTSTPARPRRARRHRLALAAGALVFALTANAQAPLAVDLPAQALDQSLNQLARLAGVQVVFAAPVARDKLAPALKGSFGARDAMERLLQGSGLVLKAVDDRTFMVEAADRADVTATLPPVTVKAEAPLESARGPVRGYVATRSGSGTKTDTPLLETPQSIAVVSAEQMTDQKATSVTEALAYTPGVVVDPGYANSFDVLYSRGFRIQDGNGGVYRDGLKLGGSGWATGKQEPYGLERVELLKGAASVLFGAAAPGGVLNVVTKQPHADHVNEVLVEGGNHAHRAVAADLGGAASDGVSGRLVLRARDGDTSVDHIPNDSRYVAPSLRWAPDAATSVTLMAHYAERRTAYIWGVPVEGSLQPSPSGQLPSNRFVGEPDFDRQDGRQTSLGWLAQHRFTENLSVHHGLRWIDSENRVRFSNLRGPSTADPRVYERRAFDELETTRGVSTDTRLQADFHTASVRHKAVAGIDYSLHHIGSVWQLASMGPLNLFEPVYGAAPGAFAPLWDDQDRQRRIGVYVQDQVKVGGLTALAGVRRDEVRSELNGAVEKTGATTGRLGVVWELAPGFAPFASWSQSFEPVSGTDIENARYKPTEGEQFELGVRWERGGFMASAALFDLVQRNVLKNRVGLAKSVQTGEVGSRGLELEGKGRVARDVHVIASYAYTDAGVTRSENADELGQPVSHQPRHQAAIWSRVDNVGVQGLHIGLGARYTGSTTDWDGTRAGVPAFTTYDVLLGYVTGAWTMRLNVTNLTDKETIACSSGWCVYGDSRRATATLAYRF
ncbi:TonB-dependent siderophore receptor [Rhizobacter sp. LjRoot28]|uniref:TonB-dependent siderophore receptor n=1 Tax=Rhizobacter sp. LjRoot28 TaxID=3342309 RepID=UPI003ECD86A8